MTGNSYHRRARVNCVRTEELLIIARNPQASCHIFCKYETCKTLSGPYCPAQPDLRLYQTQINWEKLLNRSRKSFYNGWRRSETTSGDGRRARLNSETFQYLFHTNSPPPLIHFDITPCERGLLSVVWRGLLSQKAHLSTVMITQFPVLVLVEYCKLAVHLLYKPLPVTLTGCQIL